MDMPVYAPRPGLASRQRTSVRPEWLIDAWLDLLPVRQADTLRAVHQAILTASTAIVPCVKWGNLLYLRDGRPIVQLTPFRAAAHLQLLQRRPVRPRTRGPDPFVLRLRHGQPVDAEQVTRLVVEVLRTMVR